jgi:hypothetical protein
MPHKIPISLLTAVFLAAPTFASVTTGLSGSAAAETTVKSSKSNTSDRAVTFGRDKLKGTTKNSRSINLNSSRSNKTN